MVPKYNCTNTFPLPFALELGAAGQSQNLIPTQASAAQETAMSSTLFFCRERTAIGARCCGLVFASRFAFRCSLFVALLGNQNKMPTACYCALAKNITAVRLGVHGV